MAAKRKRELISSNVVAAASTTVNSSTTLTPSSVPVFSSAANQQFSFGSGVASVTTAAAASSSSSSSASNSPASTGIVASSLTQQSISSPRISSVVGVPSPAYTSASPSAVSPASPSSLKSYILLRHKSSLMNTTSTVNLLTDPTKTTMTENTNITVGVATGATTNGGGMSSPTALITRRCNDMSIKSPHRLLTDGMTAIAPNSRLADINEEDAAHHPADSTDLLTMPSTNKNKKNRLNSTGSSVSSSTTPTPTTLAGMAMYNSGGGLLSSSSAAEPLSDCGSPMSNLTSCKDPMSPATPLNISNILHQFHIPGATTSQPSTPLGGNGYHNGGGSNMVSTTASVAQVAAAAAAANASTTSAALLNAAPQTNSAGFGRIIAAALGANRASSSAGREEVSSTAGINGYNSPDSGIGSDVRRRQSNTANGAVPSSSGGGQIQHNSSLLAGGTNSTLLNGNNSMHKMAGASAAHISSGSSSSSTTPANNTMLTNSTREAGASVAAAAAAVAAMQASNGSASQRMATNTTGGGGQLQQQHTQPQEELCLVCGDRASGYHYNALTCEGCKGFFRRSITKNAVYQCKYGGNCEIDMYMRRKCQECRLRKCLTVGMRPECVVPESQCRLKREAKMREQKIKQHHHHHHTSAAATAAGNAAVIAPPPPSSNTTTMPSVNINNNAFLDHHNHNMPTAAQQQQQQHSTTSSNNNNNFSSSNTNPSIIMTNMSTSESPSPKSTSFSPTTTNMMMGGVNDCSPETPPNNNRMQIDADLSSSSPPSMHSGGGDVQPPFRLSPQAEELISQLVACQEQFELPKQDDFSSITPLQFSGDEEFDRANRFQYVAEMAILTVQLIVEFAKRLPGFETLHREDQITLLKECTCELMILRAARRYDVRTDSIVFANNMPFTRDNYRQSGMFMNADAMYNFCRSLSIMETDNAEFAILAALSIFSDRPCVLHRKQVEAVQDVYVNALREYESLKRARDRAMFPRLIMRMTELRTLGHQWADLLFSLKLQKRRLPALLAEIWDFDAP